MDIYYLQYSRITQPELLDVLFNKCMILVISGTHLNLQSDNGYNAPTMHTYSIIIL